MSPDEINLPDAPDEYPTATDESPANVQAVVSANPYEDYPEEVQLILSKLDTLIVGMSELNGYAKATNNGVNWIGTNFQSLLTTVSKLGETGPMGILKMMKGGA